MKPIFLFLVFLLMTSVCMRAELLLHETFDFPEGTEVLGNLNGWQSDFNNEQPSPAPLAMQYTMQASPFGAKVGRSMALHPDNSKKTSYKKLPKTLNGKNIYFSFSMKLFFHKNESVLMFRATDGLSVKTGFIDGSFAAQIHSSLDKNQAVELHKAYFIVGQLQISEDGRKLGIAASAYTSADEVGVGAPATKADWQVFTTSEHVEPRIWEGIGFLNASASAAFDDLRLGTEWEDVTGQISTYASRE
jgi:hypothetical protein